MNGKYRLARWSLFLLVTLWLSGCSGYFAYKEGLDLDDAGRYDESVASYFEAVRKNPDKLEYRVRLQKARESAANDAIDEGERLTSEGRLREAAEAYSRAMSFDPSQEVARQSRDEILEKLRLEGLIEEGEQLFRDRKMSQARQIVEQALKIDPAYPAALELEKKVSAVNRTMVGGYELELDSGEPITLKFKKTDIKDAFNVISRLSGITFIYDEDIRAKTFTVFLEKATFSQALELLLRLNQLEMKVLNSRTILIYPNTRDKQKQYEDQLVQIFYLSNIDAKKAVNLLRTMLTLRKVYVHEELNALVVRDTPVAINLARQMLEAADRADSEVVYDLELISVSRSNNLNFGPELSAYGASVGFTNPGGTTILQSGLKAGDDIVGLVNGVTGFKNLVDFYTMPTATFEMLKSTNDAEVLANPRIRVKNKEKAKVHVGTREPVITVTINGTQSSENIQYVDVGVKLDVEPLIQLDGTIITKVTLEVSDATKLEPLTSGTTPLEIRTTNAQTVLTLKDGEQTVIGGLLRTNESNNRKGFPILSDIPLLGNLFTSISDSENKQEILLSITPRIVRKLSLPSVELATIWSGGEEDLKLGPNFGSFAQRFESETEQRPISALPSGKTALPMEEQAVTGTATFDVAPPSTPESSNGEESGIEAIIDNQLPETAVPTETPDVQGEMLPNGEMTPAEGSEPTDAAADSSLPEAPVSPETPVPTSGESVDQVVLPPIEIPAAALRPKLFFKGPALIDLDEEFSLAAHVSEIKGLYSAPMFVTYNPEVLEFVSAEEGDFLKQSGVTTIFTVSPNPARGQLIIGYKQGAEGGGAEGGGELFRLNFKGIKAGSGTVSFDRVNLRDVVGTRIDVETAQAVVEVR